VQQRSALDVDHFIVADVHFPCQLQRQLCNAVAVPFGFDVAQFERLCPTFQREVVSARKLGVGSAQVDNQFGVQQVEFIPALYDLLFLFAFFGDFLHDQQQFVLIRVHVEIKIHVAALVVFFLKIRFAKARSLQVNGVFNVQR